MKTFQSRFFFTMILVSLTLSLLYFFGLFPFNNICGADDFSSLYNSLGLAGLFYMMLTKELKNDKVSEQFSKLLNSTPYILGVLLILCLLLHVYLYFELGSITLSFRTPVGLFVAVGGVYTAFSPNRLAKQ